MAKSPGTHCVCVADGNPHALCWGANWFEEDDIRAHLIPLRGEAVEAIAFDGCIATDQNMLRCDGLMVLNRPGQAHLLLVELQNTRNAEHGFQQLIHTAHHRADYQAIHAYQKHQAPGPRKKQSFVITTKAIPPLKRARVERQANGLQITVNHVQCGTGNFANPHDHLIS
jgi:hypothetical protein